MSLSITPAAEARFWPKVDRRGPDDCWEWTGARSHGYGRFMLGGKAREAYRIAYELLVGPIPAGFTLDHLCRNRACVNPHHLDPVTPRENTLRGMGAPARNARRTHCPQGHPYSGENLHLYRRLDGTIARECRACDRVPIRRSRARV